MTSAVADYLSGGGCGVEGGAALPAPTASTTSTAPTASTAPVSETIAEDARESGRSWRRIVLIWGVAWHSAVVVGTLLVLVGHKPLWLLAPLAGLSATWVFLEYPWLLERARSHRVVFYHLAITSVLSFVLVWADPDLTFMASIALSQFSPLTGYRFRDLTALAAGAVVLTFPIALRSGFDRGSLAGWAVSAGSALLFNLFIGGFFVEMLNDHDRRGTLIRELESTRAQLERANHDAGVREERERLSREIHDTLAQGFTSLLMLVQAAEATLDTDPATTRQRLELAARTARENLAEARALIGGDPTAGLPLDAALQRAAARIGEELGITTSVTIEGDPQPLSANTQVVTLRVAQEALANVRKHSRAGYVAVRLVYGADGLTLSVADDGVGMEVDSASTVETGAGFGLRSMRERVKQVGGTVTVSSAPGAGTRVLAEVPYE